MKVVITGANSYIGNSIQLYIQKVDQDVEICQLDVIEEKWKEFDFSGYDVVIHVAAIVHRKDINSWDLYKKVNVDLTLEIAQKAKSQGIKQFIFLSSMAVYGVEKTLSRNKGIISKQTVLNPSSMYGRSKFIAEQKLFEIETESFKVTVVRPPNVYGPGCRGGYITTYCKVVSKLPAIPEAFTSVKQSILYIENLCRLIYLIVVHQKRGVFTPQDGTSVSAVQIMQYITKAMGIKKRNSTFLGSFIYFVAFCPLVKKAYGGVSYRQDDSHHEEFDYLVVSCEEGIKRTVLFENK